VNPELQVERALAVGILFRRGESRSPAPRPRAEWRWRHEAVRPTVRCP